MNPTDDFFKCVREPRRWHTVDIPTREIEIPIPECERMSTKLSLPELIVAKLRGTEFDLGPPQEWMSAKPHPIYGWSESKIEKRTEAWTDLMAKAGIDDWRVEWFPLLRRDIFRFTRFRYIKRIFK